MQIKFSSSLTMNQVKYYGAYNTINIGDSNKWVWDNEQEIANRWLRQWFDYGSHKTEGNPLSMRCVAYMLDAEIWTDSFGDTEGISKYVIGGPTIEMYCASYKDSHPKKYIQSRVTGNAGYSITIDEWRKSS